jgi:hypothetical protein
MLNRSKDILLPVMGGYEDDEDLASSGPAEGYSVCARCLDDRYIRAFIEESLDSKECDFCGRKGRTKNIAAPLDEVVDFILEAVNREYQHAVEALGWEGAEGGYQGAHWDSYDLIEQIGLWVCRMTMESCLKYWWNASAMSRGVTETRTRSARMRGSYPVGSGSVSS